MRPATSIGLSAATVIAGVVLLGAEWKVGLLTDERCPPPSPRSIEMLFAPCLVAREANGNGIPFAPPGTVLPPDAPREPDADATVAGNPTDGSDKPSTEGRSQR
jgi:hypothetical protein